MSRATLSQPIHSYRNYRDLIADLLQARGYSQRSFALRHPGLLSRIALAKLLSRGRSTDRQHGIYNISLEKLSPLGRALGLRPAEIQFLLILRVANDCRQSAGTTKDAHLSKKLLTQMVEEKAERLAQAQVTSEEKSVAHSLLSFMEALPELAQQKIFQAIEQEIALSSARYGARPGLQKVWKQYSKEFFKRGQL